MLPPSDNSITVSSSSGSGSGKSRSILTDRTMSFNRPDITFMNKKTKNPFLIDIAVPNTQSLAKTITEKQNSTKNWRMKYVLCGSKRQHK